jgi:hypothetical protein
MKPVFDADERKLHGAENSPFIEHRSLELHHFKASDETSISVPAERRQTFSDFRANDHTAIASWARKPDARTSPVGILRHSSYVKSDEAEHHERKIQTTGG